MFLYLPNRNMLCLWHFPNILLYSITINVPQFRSSKMYFHQSVKNFQVTMIFKLDEKLKFVNYPIVYDYDVCQQFLRIHLYQWHSFQHSSNTKYSFASQASQSIFNPDNHSNTTLPILINATICLKSPMFSLVCCYHIFYSGASMCLLVEYRTQTQ